MRTEAPRGPIRRLASATVLGVGLTASACQYGPFEFPVQTVEPTTTTSSSILEMETTLPVTTSTAPPETTTTAMQPEQLWANIAERISQNPVQGVHEVVGDDLKKGTFLDFRASEYGTSLRELFGHVDDIERSGIHQSKAEQPDGHIETDDTGSPDFTSTIRRELDPKTGKFEVTGATYIYAKQGVGEVTVTTDNQGHPESVDILMGQDDTGSRLTISILPDRLTGFVAQTGPNATPDRRIFPLGTVGEVYAVLGKTLVNADGLMCPPPIVNAEDGSDVQTVMCNTV